MTVTRKRFSVSSFIAPEMDPIAQQSVFKFAQDHSDPSTCFDNFSVTAWEDAILYQRVRRRRETQSLEKRKQNALIISVSTTSKWVR